MRKVTNVFLIWRTLLFLPLIIAPYFITQRLGYTYINPWANFDGIHYLSIAENGYIRQAAFFPLYPLLINFLSIGKEYFLSGIFVSNVSFLISLFYFVKLLRLDYSEKSTWEIVLLFLIFPTAFFFGAVYSESLFFLLLILSFYFARVGKWHWAIVFASLLTVTRLVGIFIFPALIYEYFVQKGKFNLGFLFVPLGLFIYSLFNFLKWGDGLYFIKAHAELGNGRLADGLVLFPQTMFRYFKILTTIPLTKYEWWISALELGIFCLVAALLCFAWKKKVRISYLIFSTLSFLLPVSSGTFSGLPRYVLVLFPIYISLNFLSGRAKAIWLLLSCLLFFALLMFFSRGYFVAYEFIKSIIVA